MTTASVPFMITSQQRKELLARGYSEAQINAMKPSEAHEILGIQPGARDAGDTHNALLDAALKYVAIGWHVFPVAPHAKAPPLTPNGFYDASTNRDQVHSWWSENPDANVALACGPSDIIALDVDPAKCTDETREWLCNLEANYPTVMADTPSGGRHYLFRLPQGADLGNRKGALPAGIDVCVRGYVLLAPSIVAYSDEEACNKGRGGAFEGSYTWVDGHSPDDILPHPLPDFVYKLLQPPKAEHAVPATVPSTKGQRTTPYGAKALQYELDTLTLTPEGERNNQLNKSAFSLGQLVAGGELEESLVTERLRDAGLGIGLDADEIKRTIRSGMEAGAGKPRSVRAGVPNITPGGNSPNGTPDDEADYWREQLFTMDKFLQRPPKQWLVDKVLGVRDFALVYGESGHGKTHLLLDLAFACATGRPFADTFPVARPLAVVYATGEGIGGLRDRLEAVSEYYGARPDNLFILTDVPQLYVETPQGDVAFVAAWQRMAAEDIVPPTIDVLILDTLHNASTGANENSAQDAGIILASLRNLRDALGCACVLCHHANKTGASERGSTSLRASMDTVLKTTKDRDTFTMTCDKLKDGETWPAQQFTLVCKAESVRVFWEGNVASGRTSAKTRERRVLDFLENHPQNRYTADEVAQLTGDESPKGVQNMLADLRKAGSVQAVKEKRKAKDGKERDVWVYWRGIV